MMQGWSIQSTEKEKTTRTAHTRNAVFEFARHSFLVRSAHWRPYSNYFPEARALAKWSTRPNARTIKIIAVPTNPLPRGKCAPASATGWVNCETKLASYSKITVNVCSTHNLEKADPLLLCIMKGSNVRRHLGKSATAAIRCCLSWSGVNAMRR